MATRVTIDGRLIEEARKIGGHKTKKEAVSVALQEYIKRRKQPQISSVFGTSDWDPMYDYKAGRGRKRA